MNLHRRIQTGLTIAALFVASNAFALTIDRFSDPLPPNACLPETAAPVIFWGTYCDGDACPPDPQASCYGYTSQQAGLPGVLPTARRDAQIVATIADYVVGRVNVAESRFDITVSQSRYHSMVLTYWQLTPPYLDLDLVALGIESVKLSMGGDIAPEQPIYLSVRLVDWDSVQGDATAYAQQTISAPGPISFPLSSFALTSGFDFDSIDIINVEVSDCIVAGCAQNFAARAYWIGPISFEGNATPANETSWGSVKSRYR